jgi:cobalt-zinc-cadmium efflux system protein
LRILAVTIGILAAEVVGGLYSGSLALLSDAGHVFGDFVAGLVAIYIAWRVFKGTVRETELRRAGARIHGALLILVAVGIFIEAIDRIRSSYEIATTAMFAVAVLGMLGNIWQHRILLRVKKNVTREGMHLHIRSDLVQSGVVVITAPLVWATGMTVIDGLVSAGVAIWMCGKGIQLMRGRSGHGHHHH